MEVRVAGAMSPPVLQIRDQAKVEIVAGIASEYRLAAGRYFGDLAAKEYLAGFEGIDVSMARVGVAPRWVGLVDFVYRLPGVPGGSTGSLR